MKVLAISVHPDDEVLGCGGTLLKHNEQDDELYWLIITRGDKSIGFNEDFLNKREREIEKVSARFNFKKVFKLGFLTTKLYNVDSGELIGKISSVINEIKPDIIYTVNRSDIHTDHQIASKAIMSCTKSFRYPFIKKVLMYECLSETEIAPQLPENIFIANVYSDITNYLDEKIEIMRIYESEVQESPLPRSIDNIEALARYRGGSCGVHYAEAFMLVRERF